MKDQVTWRAASFDEETKTRLKSKAAYTRKVYLAIQILLAVTMADCANQTYAVRHERSCSAK